MFIPLAVKVAEEPKQIAAELTVVVLVEVLTVTIEVAVLVQPFKSVPVTVYVIVLVGLAVTLEPVTVFKFVAGDHVYVLAPKAFNIVDVPEQIVEEVAVTVGFGKIVTVDTDELVQ